jgi:hypothetical protein
VPLILRKIRKKRWYGEDSEPWLQCHEIQADALGDLGTSCNVLSVWLIEDNLSNLEQVVAALASSGDSVSNFDYVAINIELLFTIGIEIEKIEGNTPYLEANKWHRDLIKLTVCKIAKLADLMFKSEKKRIPEKKVLALLKDAETKSLLDRKLLKEGIIRKL